LIFALSVEDDFSASHLLDGYEGPCGRLHGHNYRVRATVEGNSLDELGMVLDLRILKKALAEALAPLDHTHLNDHPDFSGKAASAEALAAYIFEKVRSSLAELKSPEQVWLREIRVAESEHSWVTYRP
jgi:6-pyruvoyltetrahydropterin/6-carboxytetrahydropterin synthase